MSEADLERFLDNLIVLVVNSRQPISPYYKEKAVLSLFLASFIFQLLGDPVGFDEGFEGREVGDAEDCSLLNQSIKGCLNGGGRVHGDVDAEDRQDIRRVQHETSGR